MKKNTEIILIAAMATTTFCEAESFGGIGLAISQEKNGAEVIYIIPETPAAKSKIKAGDFILSVDGTSLHGKNTEETKELLRGTTNKPLVIEYESKGDTLTETLRRTQITIKEYEKKEVESIFGKKQKIDVQEVNSLTDFNRSDLQLVAILQNDTLVKGQEMVEAEDFTSIFITNQNNTTTQNKQKRTKENALATLKNVTPKTICFEIKVAGNVKISLKKTDGTEYASFTMENVSSGIHILNWDSSNIVKGNYLMILENNGSFSSKRFVLK